MKRAGVASGGGGGVCWQIGIGGNPDAPSAIRERFSIFFARIAGITLANFGKYFAMPQHVRSSLSCAMFAPRKLLGCCRAAAPKRRAAAEPIFILKDSITFLVGFLVSFLSDEPLIFLGQGHKDPPCPRLFVVPGHKKRQGRGQQAMT